jgi:hypothetical protein
MTTLANYYFIGSALAVPLLAIATVALWRRCAALSAAPAYTAPEQVVPCEPPPGIIGATSTSLEHRAEMRRMVAACPGAAYSPQAVARLLDDVDSLLGDVERLQRGLAEALAERDSLRVQADEMRGRVS